MCPSSRWLWLQAVKVTDYCPAAWWVPMRLPHMLEQLLAYTFAISAALALLNMAPVYGLDGEAALRSLLQLGEGNRPFHGDLQASKPHCTQCSFEIQKSQRHVSPSAARAKLESDVSLSL